MFNIKNLLLSNKMKFEIHAKAVEMAYEQRKEYGSHAWAQIAGESEHQRNEQREKGLTKAE